MVSFGSENFMTSFMKYNYTDVITEKASYKQALLSKGVGFDGSLEYPICFKAEFGEIGSLTMEYDNLLSEMATIKVEGFSALSSEDLFIGTNWKFDITDPVHPKYVDNASDYAKYCDYYYYDPFLACYGPAGVSGLDGANVELCNLIGKASTDRPVGFISGAFGNGATYEFQTASPLIKDYYFASSYDTWGTAMITESDLCAKWIPVDCNTGEYMPIKPLLEEKLLAISESSGEKLALLSLLTGGASDVVVNTLTGKITDNFSDVSSTNDLTRAIVEKLTGTDMLAFNDKIDPSIIVGQIDPTSLISIFEKESKLNGEVEAVKSMIDPLGILATISGLSTGGDQTVVEALLNLLKSETTTIFN